MIHSTLGFFPLYVTNEGGQEMFFFGIGVRGPSPVTGDTCAFFCFVDIYFTVVSRFSPTCAVRRGPPVVSHNSSCSPGRFRRNFTAILSQRSGKCHFYDNKSPFNYLTRYPIFIKSSLLVFPTPSLSIDLSILYN